MPFEDLETHTKANTPPMASLSYLTHARKNPAKPRKAGAPPPKPKLLVTLPTAVCISKCKKFSIAIGTGADSNKLRVTGLKQGVPGGVSPHDFKAYIKLHFGYVPRFGDDIFDGVKCTIVRVNDDTYDLTIPPEVDLLEAEKAKTKANPRYIEDRLRTA
jgi:hypothetical protein